MQIKHSFPFDPTYGYTQQTLLTVGAPPDPPGFVEFWRETYRLTLARTLNIARRPIESHWDGFDVFEIEFDAFDGFRVGGWLTLSHDRSRIERGAVVGHGYSGREAADPPFPGPNAAAIFPCARGFNRSAHPSIPGDAMRHVVHGSESRETYSHRGCVTEIWSAASALLEIVPQVEGRLDYLGGSFGGGIGALAVPWEKRFRRAFLDVPSFGNHPLRVTLPCVGSGEGVREYMKTHEAKDVLDVLAYFDAATAARHITIPTFVAAAVFDPAVPPPGQFAVYNAIPGAKELFVRETAHFDWPGAPEEDRRMHAGLMEWLDR